MTDFWWHLTWRTYGTWLPGEAGFVGHYRTRTGQRVIDNAYNTPTAPAMPALAEYARRVQSHDSVLLTAVQAPPLLAQLQETSRFRGWALQAVAILAEHVHGVVALPDGTDGHPAMNDLKAYGSRALNRLAGVPQKGS